MALAVGFRVWNVTGVEFEQELQAAANRAENRDEEVGPTMRFMAETMAFPANAAYFPVVASLAIQWQSGIEWVECESEAQIADMLKAWLADQY